MLLDLEKVPVDGQAVDRAVNLPAAVSDGKEFRLAGPVSVKGRISRTDEDAFNLSGCLVAELELACVRCLATFEASISEDLDLLFLPQADNVAPGGEDDRGLRGDELLVSFYRDDQIDLSHMAWEQVVLALPMKPLCKSECKGLCPECGVNRNSSSCSCVRDDTDPRWQALKGLLDR